MATPAIVAPAHPWQRTLRTGLALLLALLPVLPELVDQLGISTLPVVVAVLAVAGAITRALALPQVEQVLRKYAPWLSASDVASSQVIAQVVHGEVVAGEAHPAKTGRKVKTPAVDDGPPEGD